MPGMPLFFMTSPTIASRARDRLVDLTMGNGYAGGLRRCSAKLVVVAHAQTRHEATNLTRIALRRNATTNSCKNMCGLQLFVPTTLMHDDVCDYHRSAAITNAKAYISFQMCLWQTRCPLLRVVYGWRAGLPQSQGRAPIATIPGLIPAYEAAGISRCVASLAFQVIALFLKSSQTIVSPGQWRCAWAS